jgi:hypothetical protein
MYNQKFGLPKFASCPFPPFSKKGPSIHHAVKRQDGVTASAWTPQVIVVHCWMLFLLLVVSTSHIFLPMSIMSFPSLQQRRFKHSPCSGKERWFHQMCLDMTDCDTNWLDDVLVGGFNWGSCSGGSNWNGCVANHGEAFMR